MVMDAGMSPAGGGARILIRRTEDGVGVHNPRRRSIGMMLFLGLWLCGWTAGEYFALSQLLGGGTMVVDLFLIVWVTGWTVGGVLVWTTMLWQLFGVEKIFLLDAGALVVERGFGLLTRRTIYMADRITDLTAREIAYPDQPLPPRSIAFRYDGREQRFGLGLDAGETRAVLDLVEPFLARYRPAPEQAAAGA